MMTKDVIGTKWLDVLGMFAGIQLLNTLELLWQVYQDLVAKDLQ